MPTPHPNNATLRQRLFANPISRGAILIAAFAFVVFQVTRFSLAFFEARKMASWDSSLLGALVLGIGFDLLAAFYVSLVWIVLSALVASRPLGWWRLGLIGAIFGLVYYGLRGQGWYAMGAVAFIFISPVLCTFGKKSGRIFTIVMVCAFVAALLFNAVAEWLFWDEFGVRLNFIAVDYLIYTQEVIGNINESYPMPAIITALVLVTGGVVAIFWKRGWLRGISEAPFPWKNRLAPLMAAGVLFGLTAWFFSQSQLPKFDNNYNSELAKNGLYSFGAAFWENEIDYSTFYPTHDIQASLAGCQKQLSSPAAQISSNAPGDMRRTIKKDGAEKKWNVILVCVESFSGDYMGRLGNKRGLTPNLDRIADEGVFFKNVYATGTRTVRGMEALTMSIPPTPGQSLLRRPDCTDMFSLGSLFGSRGYDCAFLYGGNGLFDNMNYFFRNNGYRIVDLPTKEKKDVTFQNAWGACDEDMFRWTIEEADRSHAAGKPFHSFCMTTSNHRPFSFPLDGVDLKDSSGQELTDGPKRTVKYTDYAINKLLEMARTKPWFANTVFVIVADHCAFSAGKAELDVTKFHIPATIWNPGLIQPRVVNELCSQIDVLPTLFGMMNWSYTTRFFGMDVLDPAYNETNRRAFVSNYQKIGYLKDDTFAILKPKKEYSLYDVNRRSGELTPNAALTPLLDQAIDAYQSAAFLYKAGRMKSSVEAP